MNFAVACPYCCWGGLDFSPEDGGKSSLLQGTRIVHSCKRVPTCSLLSRPTLLPTRKTSYPPSFSATPGAGQQKTSSVSLAGCFAVGGSQTLVVAGLFVIVISLLTAKKKARVEGGASSTKKTTNTHAHLFLLFLPVCAWFTRACLWVFGFRHLVLSSSCTCQFVSVMCVLRVCASA